MHRGPATQMTQTESSALPGTHINPSSTHKNMNTAKSCSFSSAHQGMSSSVSTPPRRKLSKSTDTCTSVSPSNPGQSVPITSVQSPCPCPGLCLSSLQSWLWNFPDTCLFTLAGRFSLRISSESYIQTPTRTHTYIHVHKTELVESLQVYAVLFSSKTQVLVA